MKARPIAIPARVRSISWSSGYGYSSVNCRLYICIYLIVIIIIIIIFFRICSSRPKWLCRPPIKRLLRQRYLPDLRFLQSKAVPFVGPAARLKNAARFTEWNTVSSGALNANGRRLALASASKGNPFTHVGIKIFYPEKTGRVSWPTIEI